VICQISNARANYIESVVDLCKTHLHRGIYSIECAVYYRELVVHLSFKLLDICSYRIESLFQETDCRVLAAWSK
jgi:hypothetical protein